VGISAVGRSFTWPQGKQLTASPTARLSAGESYTFRRIMILKSKLNQHSEKKVFLPGRFFTERISPSGLHTYKSTSFANASSLRDNMLRTANRKEE
jgi:hypothetical protein